MELNVELTDEEFESNMDEIFAELSLCAKPSSHPTFVMVGGQAGSGKSVLVAKENQNLEGSAIIIDQDELRTKYPADKYQIIHENCTEREEFLLLKPYITKTIAALKDRARDGRYNIILESALRSVKTFIGVTEELKDAGYTTKLSVLAVPEVEGNISMLTRYCYYLEKDGECRRNTRLDHSSVQKLSENLVMLDELGIFDDIAVSIRGENIDSLPVQIYSKQQNPNITPIQAYEKGKRMSFKDTAKNFEVRYAQIKETLVKYGYTEQLEKLEQIKQAFEIEKAEMR